MRSMLIIGENVQLVARKLGIERVSIVHSAPAARSLEKFKARGKMAC